MNSRFGHLDGLRGLAALNVVLGHAVLAFDFALYTGNPAHSHGWWDIALSGLPFLLPVAGQNFSVCVFLVMSGFVLAHAFGNTGLGPAALAAKRYARLGIPIFAATMLSWLLLDAGLMQNHAAAAITRSAWLDLQLAQAPGLGGALQEGVFGALLGPWDYGSSVDTSLWTMSVEFAGSLLLITVFTVRRRYRILGQDRLTSAAVLLLAGVALYPLYVSLLLVGAALALLDLRRVRWPGPAVAAAVAVALLVGTLPYSAARPHWLSALVALVPSHGLPLPFGRLGPAAAAMDAPSVLHGLGAVLLLIAVETSAGLRRFLARPGLAFLGAISFPLYIVHVPVLLSVGCGGFLLAGAVGAPFWAAAGMATAGYAAVAVMVATLAVPVIERPSIAVAGRVASSVERLAGPGRRARPYSPPLPS